MPGRVTLGLRGQARRRPYLDERGLLHGAFRMTEAFGVFDPRSAKSNQLPCHYCADASVDSIIYYRKSGSISDRNILALAFSWLRHSGIANIKSGSWNLLVLHRSDPFPQHRRTRGGTSHTAAHQPRAEAHAKQRLGNAELSRLRHDRDRVVRQAIAAHQRDDLTRLQRPTDHKSSSISPRKRRPPTASETIAQPKRVRDGRISGAGPGIQHAPHDGAALEPAHLRTASPARAH